MFSLYKETLINLDAPDESTTSSYALTASNNDPAATRVPLRASSAKSEADFASKCLASDGSIYFRQAQIYPRCFLWRIIDDDKTLEIRCADLVKSRHEQHDATAVVRFTFPSPIISRAVAFADIEGQDHIHCFAITESRDLYTLKLQSDLFRGTTDTLDDLFKSCTPSYFTLHRPFRLQAHSPFELFVMFDNGALQRLTRKAQDDGSQWTQHNYDEKWSTTFRGMIPWQGKQSLKYQGRNIDQATGAAVVALSDSTHAFMVCLNHTLRVWNLTTGHLVVTKDLLDQPRTPQDVTSVTLNPASNTMVKLLKLGFSGQTYIITYSPHNEGYFKFWSVRNQLTSQLELNDAFPAATLKASDPDPSGNSVWSMTGFDVRPTDASNIVEMWVLWQNNTFRELHSIKLDLSDVERSWRNDWVRTIVSDRSNRQPSNWMEEGLRDPTSRWLECILSPGAYSSNVLETALSAYQEVLKSRLPASEKHAPLAQRLCSTVMSSVNARRYAGADMDYDRFETELDRQWQAFWRIAENLQERRTTPVALAVDAYANMPWIVMADSCAAIRECTDIEVLSCNDPLTAGGQVLDERWTHRKLESIGGLGMDKVAALLRTASLLRQRLPGEMLSECNSLLEVDLFEDSELPLPLRVANIYEGCNFSAELADEVYESIVRHFESFNGVEGLSNEIFYVLFEKFPENVSKPESQLQSTDFGQLLISEGVRNVIEREYEILFELFLLLMFIDFELDTEDAQTPDFSSADLYFQLHTLLREYSKKKWLASNYRESTVRVEDADDAPYEDGHLQRLYSRSLLHDLFVRDIRPQPAAGIPQSFILTQAIDDVIAWTRAQDNVSFEDGLVHIQCVLLISKDLDLARDFLRYQPSTAWSTYVKGRFYLADGNFDTAALYFQKASHSLARGKAHGDLHESSAGMLSLLDTENFHNGLPRYFQHVLALFESAKAYSQSATFAQLALQVLDHKLDGSEIAMRQDILARLFMAEIKLLRYTAAFTALSQYTDPALQKSAMATLVRSMFTSAHGNTNLDQSLELLQTLPLGANSALMVVVDETLDDLHRKEIQQASDFSPSTRIERAIGLLNVLHGYRLHQKDYRGAVEVLLSQMKLVKQLLESRSDEDAMDLRNMLLAIINALACAPPDEAFILTSVEEQVGREDEMEMVEETRSTKPVRVILTLRELRQEYQQLLDRYSRIERGDFEFAMDEDPN